MMKVKNSRTVRAVAFRQLKTSRVRNLFAVIAIILTTVLITAVFTIGISLIDGMQQMTLRQAGRTAEATVQYAAPEEIGEIITHPLVKEHGLSRLVAMTSEGIFRQNPCEIRWMDDSFAEKSMIDFVEGGLPKSPDEVAVMAWMLDAMDLPREVGQVIHLDFQVEGESYSLDLTVSGFWESDLLLQPYGWALVHEETANRLLQGVDPRETRMTGTYSGVYQIYLDFTSEISQLETSVEQVFADTGLDLNILRCNLNPAYENQGGSDLAMGAAVGAVVLIIIISGYLLIYNIFYISVVRDIGFYGILKTIGTTNKQIRQIVNIQALILYGIAMPFGLGIGYLLGAQAIPIILNFINIDYAKPTLNPWIFVLGALLALVTVLISSHNPAKIAGSVSPIEAVRFTDTTAHPKRKTHRGKAGGNIPKMALYNLTRNKKKLALVISSVTIGLILFNTMATFVNSYDLQRYLRSYITGDFLVADGSYFNLVNPYAPTFTLTEEVAGKMEQLEGVDRVDRVYYETVSSNLDEKGLAALKEYHKTSIQMWDSALTEDEVDEMVDTMEMEEKIDAQLYGFTPGLFNALEEAMGGSFDEKKFSTGGYVVIANDYLDLWSAGDTVTLTVGGEEHTYEVMGVAKTGNYLYGLSAHFVTSPGFVAYLPATAFPGYPDVNLMSCTVHGDEGKLDELDSRIRAIVGENPDLDIRSRSDYIAELRSENQQIALIGMTLCAVILIIGLLNYVNTTMTNIISRRQELAMLQSIGMTGRQIKKMLILECIYSLGLSSLLLVTLGSLFSYAVVGALASGSAAYTFTFTPLPLLICLPVLALLAVALPLLVYRSISKASVVERLREAA